MANQVNDDQDPKSQPSQNQPFSTSAGQSATNINQTSAGNSKVGRRRQNPLSNFASYTYNLSLYMITPDAYEAFIASDRTDVNIFRNLVGTNAPTGTGGGAILIAKSGGINNSESARAPGFELDYYIDDLEMVLVPPNTELRMSAGTFDVKFKIIEPYGFSLVTNLVRANKYIEQYMLARGYPSPPNPTKQHFILAIEFFGYGDDGKPLTGPENFGGTLDPNANLSGGLFKKYLDLELKEFKFRLDGKATTYFIRSAVKSDSGLGTIRGFIKQSINVAGPTVNEVLNGQRGLITALNAYQQGLKDSGAIEYAVTYDIQYKGQESESIGNASVLTPNQVNEYSFGMSPPEVKTTDDSTALAEFANTPNVFSNSFQFGIDTPIVKAIENIIARSTYLTDAMKKLNANQKQPENNSLQILNQGSRVDIAWFSTTPVLKNPRWDKKQKIWVYDITYVIQRYETPIIMTPYANPGTVYYGPHKVYDYWLTGNNNEVISFEQEFNNIYFVNVVAGAPEGLQLEEVSNTSDTPMPVGGSVGGAKLGSVNRGQNQDFQNGYLTTLFDQKATVNAKITILGDPDYINQGETASVNTVFNKYYNRDGYTISYGGGQTFIEINFYEGQDYDNNTGLFTINEKIAFYQQRAVNDMVEGLSYRVFKVTSKFNQGKFTQMLDCVLNDFGFAKKPSDGTARTTEEATQGSGVTSTGSATSGNGLKQDEPIATGQVTDPVNTNPEAPGSVTVTDRNGRVVDGEGEPFVGTFPPPFYDQGGREDGIDFREGFGRP